MDAEQPFLWRDTAITALAPLCWGSTYIVTTQFLPPGRPFASALIRVLPAGLLLVAWMRRVPARGEWWRVTVLAALNIGAFQALLFMAAYRLPGGVAAVIGAIQPLVVMALVWAFDRRRPPALAAAAALLGLVGMALLLRAPQSAWDAVGVAAALTGAVSMAAGTWLTRRWRPVMPALAWTGWQLLLGGLMLLPLAWLAEPPPSPMSRTQILAYAYLGGIGGLLAYALWFHGVLRAPPMAVSSLGLISPLAAVALGWALLGQAITAPALLGLMMVLVSVFTVQLSMARASSSRPAIANMAAAEVAR